MCEESATRAITSRRRKPAVRVVCASFFAFLFASSANAQKPESDWPLEEISLRTGGEPLRGLIESESPAAVEFVEVVRNPGQKPYIVIRTIAPRDIAKRRPLPQRQREELARRVDRIRNRARVLRQQIDSVTLVREGDGAWKYHGPRFSFISTADEPTTRRAIVRLEQMFAAFRQVLRPQHTVPKRRLRFLFFGSLAEYRAFLADEGLSIDNPAFYSPEQNVVAAGSELSAVAAQIAAAEARHRDVMAEYKRAADAQRKKLRAAVKKKDDLGWTDADVREIVQATERRLRSELDRVRRRIQAANRQQETRFDVHSRRLFSRLYHEAFHAYVENFVFESDRHDVPVWLNEGLAQVFESARVDVDELRLGAVDTRRLVALDIELKRDDALSIRDMLNADRQVFLVEHRSDRASERHYLFAWAVAYYLTQERNLLESKALSEYVAQRRADSNQVRRFERLVGSNIADFQREWQRHMKTLWQEQQP
ncbi:MAG: DUF1570 domain-containing protein [Pirellulales bacterium]|nr:DUF1570 domain-containing protein [Pirellulales bacterium]